MSSILKTNAIEPEGATTELVVGKSGQAVTVGGSGGLKTNTFKDAGGNTLWTSDGSGTVSNVSGFGGAQVLISSQIASNSASISFTSGIDSTYKEYVFEFIDVNPATDNVHFQFQTSTDGGSSYGVTATTTYFDVYHNENDAGTALEYRTASDLAQSTSYQKLMGYLGNGADECGVGELHLFNPSSTTYVKQFYVRTSNYRSSDVAYGTFPAGYFNTTTALNAINFKMSSGNFDGTIKMYGIK